MEKNGMEYSMILMVILHLKLEMAMVKGKYMFLVEI